jgi:hypothetical protein
MPSSPSGLDREQLRDDRAPVAPLGDVPRVAEPDHELVERAGHPGRTPAGRGRLGGEAVTGHRRQHQVEGVGGLAAVGRRVGERVDNLQQLDDRARPAVGHEQRQGVLVGRADVGELDVEPVDLGDELGQCVQRGFGLAPVVAAAPVLDERAELGQLDPLGPVVDRLPVRPPRGRDAPAQVVDLLLWDFDTEGADGGLVDRCAWLGGTPAGRCRLGHYRSSHVAADLCHCDDSITGPRGRSNPAVDSQEWSVAGLVARRPGTPNRPAASATGQSSGRWAGPGRVERAS